MDEINVGEIVYATITVKDTENKERELKKVVFSRGWECNYPKLDKENYKRFLTQNGLCTSKGVVIECEVIGINILKIWI